MRGPQMAHIKAKTFFWIQITSFIAMTIWRYVVMGIHSFTSIGILFVQTMTATSVIYLLSKLQGWIMGDGFVSKVTGKDNNSIQKRKTYFRSQIKRLF